MHAEDIIKRPLMLTEKGTVLREQENKYLFEVSMRANKVQIKNAVEELFDVDVLAVRTMIVLGRMRRMGRGRAKTKNWKKAIVELVEGDEIDFYEES